MQKKMWLLIALLLVIPGLLFMVGCQKKAVTQAKAPAAAPAPAPAPAPAKAPAKAPTPMAPADKSGIYPDESHRALAKLIGDLERRKRKITSSVITFNYDIALDYAFGSLGHPIDYCISEAPARGSTPLLKLHGSLNWASCSKCGEIIPWYIGDFLNF